MEKFSDFHFLVLKSFESYKIFILKKYMDILIK